MSGFAEEFGTRDHAPKAEISFAQRKSATLGNFIQLPVCD